MFISEIHSAIHMFMFPRRFSLVLYWALHFLVSNLSPSLIVGLAYVLYVPHNTVVKEGV